MLSADSTDDELRAAIGDADPTTLLPALAWVTGDLSLARDDLHLDPLLTGMPDGGWTPEQVTRARDLAFIALRRFLDEGGRPVEPPSDADRRQLIDWVAGRELDDDHITMFTEELALEGDRRSPSWHRDDIAAGDLSVAIIGAGMSGILAAHRLHQAGIPVVVLEKNPDIGGTWFENTYPGCRVDLPNHVYAYSNAQRHDWPYHHSTQDVLLDYFKDCAHDWGVTEHIRFDTCVESMTWDDDDGSWVLHLATRDGPEVLRATAVVSAVGQLNQPKLPDLEGRDDFAGLSFHSSRWPQDLDLGGKLVAVIGTGASAMQFIPHVAEDAAHLTIFQRTPAWLIPRPEYHEPVADGLIDLFAAIPGYTNWYRLRRFWMIHHGALDALVHDPQWDGPIEQAVSADNDLMRELLTEYLRAEFADRPDLLDKVIPRYPVGAKRFVLDNGIWPRTLKRDDVELVTDPIERITPTGVRAAGRDHQVDIIIYGTGFNASRFLTPMQVTGRNGLDLHEVWGDDARAYLGMTVPGFPNLFCLYGPNTNIVINGSIIYFSECSVRYLVEMMGILLERHQTVAEVRADVHAAFVDEVDHRNGEMAWGLSSVNSWYKSPSGRIAQNWPFALIDYWRRTRAPDPDEYVLR
ncbi:MAG: NAD(P)/FAD-dependent oxidoreductase [Acidimicrobiia bacterium]|nr:NAD(P)/FAD-dependent oxidoreductase [Acidimicrobiia bacterium]